MSDNNTMRQTAARAFVRSLNILLKFARLYDFGHPRTARQYDTAWSELQVALGKDDDSGMLLAVSGDQLLLDGTPLDTAASEKSFARMLSTAGIASVHFSPRLTHASLQKFVRSFPTGSSSKPAQLAEQLKASLHGDPHIHVNEVCFVPADSAVARSTMAAQLAARALGMNPAETDKLLNDPEKLLQLIVAADGKKGGGGSGGPGGGGSGGSCSAGGGSGGVPSVSGPVGAVYGAGGPGDGFAGSGWNIVGGSGGSGGGTPLDPNAGGFWLNKDAAAKSGTPGPTLSGPAAGVGEALASGWNFVGNESGTAGGSGAATKLDPNAGGFWLTKDSEAGAGGASKPVALSGDASSVVPSGGAGNGETGTGGNGSGNGGGGWTIPGVSPHKGSDSRWASASTGIRATRSARGGSGSMAVETGLMTLHEDELQGILQVLAQIARTNDASQDRLDPGAFQSRLSTLPRRARFTVSQALSALAAQAPTENSDKPTLLKLAEHIAVRFALESYERGDLKVNAVRQMLDEMNSELDGLRKILGVYEEKMAAAGIHTQTHMDVLAQDFWLQVPDEKKKSVLEGPDAWCVPGVRLREYVEKMIERGEKEDAEKVLKNYANGLSSKNAEARRQTAMGLPELAGLYARSSESLFMDTIRDVGLQLADEKDGQLQSLLE